MAVTLNQWDILDPFRMLKDIEAAHGSAIFDAWAYLDPTDAAKQLSSALGVAVSNVALLDPARFINDVQPHLGGGAYAAKAFHLDGLTMLHRGSLLDGVIDTSKYLLLVWMKDIAIMPWSSAAGPGIMASFPNNSFEPQIHHGPGNLFGVSLNDASFANSIGPDAVDFGDVTGLGWKLFAQNVDTSQNDPDKVVQFLINDTLVATSYDGSGSVPGFNIGVVGSGSPETDFYVLSAGYLNEVMSCDAAICYLALGQNLDLSNPANIAKLISGGKPVDPGADGSSITGSRPTIFIDGADGTNKGTGGPLSFQQVIVGIGAADAASISLPGAVAGNTVVTVRDYTGGFTTSVDFESVISVNDQIQQLSGDHAGNTLLVQIDGQGALTNASSSPSD